MVADARSEHEQDRGQATAEMVRLTVAPAEAAVVAGGEVALTVTFYNTSDAPASCLLDLTGAPATWSTVDESSVELDPGGRRRLAVVVRPPATMTPTGEGAPARLTVQALVDGRAAPAAGAVALTVGAPDRLSLELTPAEAEGREATFRATVVNPMETPAAVALLVADGGAGLRVRVEPAGTVLVPPGERVTLLAHVAPPRDAPVQPATYEITVRAQDVGALDDTSPYLTRDARFVYVPRGGTVTTAATAATAEAAGAAATAGPRPSALGDAPPAPRQGRRLPIWLLIGAPLLLAAIVVGAIALYASGSPGNGSAAASLPAIQQFATTTDPRTHAPVLRWRVVGASVTTLDGAPVAPASSKPLVPAPARGNVATQTHLLRATNSQGTVVGMVTAPAAASTPVALGPPAIATFELRHNRHGALYRVVWTVRDATRVTLDGALVALEANHYLPLPFKSHTYTLVASNAFGQVSARVSVVVRLASAAPATPTARSYTVAPVAP